MLFTPTDYALAAAGGDVTENNGIQDIPGISSSTDGVTPTPAVSSDAGAGTDPGWLDLLNTAIATAGNIASKVISQPPPQRVTPGPAVKNPAYPAVSNITNPSTLRNILLGAAVAALALAFVLPHLGKRS